MNKDLAMIRAALAREGRVDGDDLVVPADFFTRLNAALNPPRKRSFLDELIEKATKADE